MTNQTYSTNAGQPNTAQIAQRAYEIWDKAGRPDGRSAEHWFQAEKELSHRTIVSAPASAAPRAESSRPNTARAPKARMAAARN